MNAFKFLKMEKPMYVEIFNKPIFSATECSQQKLEGDFRDVMNDYLIAHPENLFFAFTRHEIKFQLNDSAKVDLEQLSALYKLIHTWHQFDLARDLADLHVSLICNLFDGQARVVSFDVNNKIITSSNCDLEFEKALMHHNHGLRAFREP